MEMWGEVRGQRQYRGQRERYLLIGIMTYMDAQVLHAAFELRNTREDERVWMGDEKETMKWKANSLCGNVTALKFKYCIVYRGHHHVKIGFKCVAMLKSV